MRPGWVRGGEAEGTVTAGGQLVYGLNSLQQPANQNEGISLEQSGRLLVRLL